MTQTVRATFSAALSALEATYEGLQRGSSDAPTSIKRIAGRIHDAAIGLGLREVAHAAAAVLEAVRPEEVIWLTRNLIQQLQHLPEDEAGEKSLILMVEDDRLTGEVMGDALRRETREVILAHSAAEATDFLTQRSPSLILLDLVLPDADGRDLLVRLRANPQTQHTPIVVLTARSDPSAQSECFALGADAVLIKPVHPDVLSSAVAARLQQSREQRQESRIDRLTGLPNRAGFFDALQRMVPAARELGRPIAVAMIDIDHFKAVNDTHGHATGDVVLQRAGQRIASALRISDFVARWGGEEFCVLLPNTTEEGAVTALNKALTEVRAVLFNAPDGGLFSVTFSAGIASLEPGMEPDAALEEADRLLYVAKAAGRNRVLSSSEASHEPPRPRALLVEDEPNVAKVVTALLEKEGFAVLHVADAESAMEAWGRDTFALVITDVGLPGMSGFDLVREIRATRAMATLPILMLTASDEEESVVKGFELGANDYVTKPFHSAELAARIRRLTNRR